MSDQASNNKPKINKHESGTQKENSSNTLVQNKSFTATCNKRVSSQVSCIGGNKKETATQKPDSDHGIPGNKRSTRTCGIRLLPRRSEFSAIGFIKHVGDKMTKGLCFASLSLRLRLRLRKRHVAAVSSSGRSKPFVIPVDSHRNEAIEDCIEFINSSASLPRSNSVSATSA